MSLIRWNITEEEWISAPEWQRDRTESGKPILVARNPPADTLPQPDTQTPESS